MPASINETVTASLLLSLSNKTGPENGEVPLDQRMAAAAKRVLLTDIDYETSNDTYHSSVLQNLKAKYTDQNDKSRLSNGNGSSTPQVKPAGMQSSSPSIPTPARVLYSMEKVQMLWSSRANNGSGFINAGNSCYLNSVLQALFHIPPLFNWLMEGDQAHQRSCPTYNNSSSECIICCMAVTLKQSQQRNNGDTRPHLILQRLRSICRRLIPGQQEDAMEFLRYLFEAMEKNYLHRFSNLKLDNYSKETTPLNQIFGGYIRTDVTCLKCRGVSTTFQHFLDLTLDISRGSSLEQALDTYFSQERLEGDNSYRCDKCRHKVPAAKQFFIERLPNVLCIQLKRFSIEGKKISKSLQLAERINVQRFLSRPKVNMLGSGSPQMQRPRSCYRLAAGVNHLGHTAQSGHYTTTAYTASGQLYLFDDSCVQKQWSRGFSGTDVYLLMYVLEANKQQQPEVRLPGPSATATSSPQLYQKQTPMKVVAANTFLPTQCRLKPSIILNQQRKPMFPLGPALENKSPVTPTSAILPNKSSKIGVVIPCSKESSATATVQSSSSTSATSTSPSKEKTGIKMKNGQILGRDMPILVPYKEEDHSSGDEGSKVTETKAIHSTNGWTVTENGHGPPRSSVSSDSFPLTDKKFKSNGEIINGAKPVPDSTVKLPKVTTNNDSYKSPLGNKTNGFDTLKKLSHEKIVVKSVEQKRLSNGNSYHLENDCNVKSTVATWRVTDCESAADRISVHPEPRDASWVITSAPTSEPTSSEPSPHPVVSPSPPSSPFKPTNQQRAALKRKSPSSDSSSDSDSSSSKETTAKKKKKKHRSELDAYEWVEMTKETVNLHHDKQKIVKKVIAEKPYEYKPAVADELKRLSHSGYGGSTVSTWNGGRSLVDRQVRDDRRERRRADQDNDYDPEIDGGRRKKIKTHHEDYESSDGNRFQQVADHRRQQESDYRRYNYDNNNYNNGRGQGHYRNDDRDYYGRGNSQKPQPWRHQHRHNDHRRHNNRNNHHSWNNNNFRHHNSNYNKRHQRR